LGLQLIQRCRAEGFVAGDAFEEDAGGCVEVGGGGGGFACPLLRCHVGGCAGMAAATRQDGDAEVDEFALSVVLDEDVGGFVVAVDDPDRVCGGQTKQ